MLISRGLIFAWEEINEAHAATAEVLRMKPDFSTAAYAISEPFKNPADQRHVLDAFRAAGLPE